MENPETQRIETRATINLPGVRAGETVLVDPTNDYVAECIAAEFLVPVADRPS